MSKTDFQNGFALGLATGGVVQVVDTTETDALSDLIDESGVLDNTEGTVTEKVERLIDKVNELDVFANITNASQLFYKAASFPNKAVVSLPASTNVYQAFAYWGSVQEPVPSVDELTVSAPNIDLSNNQACMGQMFTNNYGVRKIILTLPDGCQYMINTFTNTKSLVEIVFNFSTKRITNYSNAFMGSTVEKISGVLDFSSATSISNMFNGCNNLKNVTFAPDTLSLSISLANSNMLTSTSIQSIIDGLATVETAQTLTFHKSIALTDEQKASINAKGWTLAQ